MGVWGFRIKSIKSNQIQISTQPVQGRFQRQKNINYPQLIDSNGRKFELVRYGFIPGKQDLHGGGIFFKRRKRPSSDGTASLARLIDR